jgi:pimeloyl-ACP methyl ester carboxylesterase
MTSVSTFEDGAAGAPPLVLIHGTAASSQSWYALLPHLTRAHRVIRVDLPGCGSSAPLADYDVPTQARLVGEALDRLSTGPAVVAGHSSGGAIATALAEERPDLVSAVVVINTGPSMDAYIAPSFTFDPSDWSSLTEAQLRQTVAQAFAPGFEVPQDAIDQVRTMDFKTFAATSMALRAYLNAAPLPSRLAPLGKPLLVIFGEQDLRWRASSATDYLTVPGARVETLPAAGHTPIVEDPATTAALLLSFTAAVKA